MKRVNESVRKSVGLVMIGTIVGIIAGVLLASNTGQDMPQESEHQEAVASADVINPEKNGGNKEIEATEKEEKEPEVSQSKVLEIEIVDYPFSYGMKDWRLILCEQEIGDEESGYRFRLYDGEGNLKQDFPCDMEADRFVFRFDALYDDGIDLVVFPADAETDHTNGLLFAWDYRNNRFIEEPIMLPWYEEINNNSEQINHHNAFLVTDKQDSIEIETIYCINRETRQLVELRNWTLTHDEGGDNKGELYIWDCLAKTVLYDGEVQWNSTGELINDEYYQDMFWADLQHPRYCSSDTEIYTAKEAYDENGIRDFEEMTYESREAFLDDYGFGDAEPFYQYYDRFGNLEMELYLDKDVGMGCGFYYTYEFNYELYKTARCSAFVFDRISEEEWNDDTFSTLTWYEQDAQLYTDNPRLISQYTDDGRLSFYQVRGITEETEQKWSEGIESMDDPLLTIDWIYRNDGTLYHKYYYHDSAMFAATGYSQDVYYDELGREVYRDEYVAHGAVDWFYIYDDDNRKPHYCLLLDQKGVYSVPMMLVYH